MSIRHLDRLFRPRSLAVFGASERAGSVGRAVLANLLQADFDGPIWPINPKYRKVQGLACFHRLSEIDRIPDLGLICTPPSSVPQIIDELGAAGCRAAVVLTAGFDAALNDGRDLAAEMLEAAGRHGLRLLGPNCVGLIVPGLKLNASFAPAMARPGPIAFLTQSGGLATAVLDWAEEREIGFSSFVSMGNCLDVDIPDVIDYFSSDPATQSILLYLESVGDGRKFLSAATSR